MKKQVIVIGLGQFGMALTRSLSERGVEVIAIDTEEDKIQIASGFATEALVLDATDEVALARINPGKRDACICAVGDQSKEAAIIVTALLKQMGVKRIIARANDDLHKRILHLVGAHEVVNPERAFGERFANRIVYEHVLEEMTLGTDLIITEFRVPASFAGKTLVELDLRRRYELIVVAIRPGETAQVKLPDPNEVIGRDDILVVVSHEGRVARLLERT